MRFAFFRPNNHHKEYFHFLKRKTVKKIWSAGEGILTGIASRLVWEKNAKVAVCVCPIKGYPRRAETTPQSIAFQNASM